MSPTTFTTVHSPGVVIGHALNDQAHLSSGSTPGGKIVFELFGPNDTACTGTPVLTDEQTVNGAGRTLRPATVEFASPFRHDAGPA